MKKYSKSKATQTQGQNQLRKTKRLERRTTDMPASSQPNSVERKLAQERLTESGELYRQLFYNNHDAILVSLRKADVTLPDRFILVNDAACQRLVYTREVTSLAGFSETHVRNLLRQLQAERLIERTQVGKYLGWGIRNKGLRIAHRSWNVPKGSHFAKDRGEFRYAGERHRRVARMWRAWLETAYPKVEIWECWTEVPVRYGIPDALAWGTHCGQEMLFWLEVDSGHSSRNTMEANYGRRLELVYAHAARWQTPIVFCILGLPWVVDAFRWCFPNTNPWVALIGHDWREFGKLPEYEFGRWHEDLDASRRRRES